MKKLIIILLFFATRVCGQSHQSDILKFVKDNMGKKIGEGYCYELVESAIQTYNPSYDATVSDKNKYGKEIKLKDVQIGDILRITGGTKRTASHVCIVYDIDGEDIWVAEQNTKGSLKNSIVVVSLLDYDWHKELYGKVRYNYYRPQ